MDALNHTDCRNYAPLDVAKGICHRSKELVLADTAHCEHFVATEKCKFCAHFAAGERYLGACNAAPGNPMAYPDLVAVTCEHFVRTCDK